MTKNFLYCQLEERVQHAGDKVKGLFVFVIREPLTPLVDDEGQVKIMLRLTGIELAEWFQSITKSLTYSTHSQQKTVIDKTFTFSVHHLKFDDTNDGCFCVPFEFDLNPDLPSSYAEAISFPYSDDPRATHWVVPATGSTSIVPVKVTHRTSIQYSLNAWINDPKEQPILSSSVPLCVSELAPGNLPTGAIIRTASKVFWLSGGQPVKITATLDNISNSMNIPIPIIISVNNPSTRQVDFIEVSLIQYVTYTAEQSKIIRKSTVFTSAVPDSIIAPNSFSGDKLYWITIPKRLKTATMSRGQLISVNYELAVCASVATGTDLQVTLPINLFISDVKKSSKLEDGEEMTEGDDKVSHYQVSENTIDRTDSKQEVPNHDSATESVGKDMEHMKISTELKEDEFDSVPFTIQ